MTTNALRVAMSTRDLARWGDCIKVTCLISEPTGIAMRAYVVHSDEKRCEYNRSDEPSPNRNVVCVLDTETTVDSSQSLLFGSFGVWIASKLHRFIVFHADRLPKNELRVLQEYVKSRIVENVNIELVQRSHFIDEVFYPYLYDSRSVLVGFNLPFDLSRLAIDCGLGRGRWRGGFTFTLSKNRFRSPIHIKSIDSTKAFVQFAPSPRRNQRHPRRHYKGCFLDLRTLGFALTNERLSLERACKLFQTHNRKIRPQEHGRITPEYIDYNVQDILATYDLYLKMIERFNSFHLTLPPEKAYSPASIGKQYLKQMSLRSFREKNPGFPPEILGYVMTTYFGGRSEVRMRKKPMKVRYMDFTSMYPTMFTLMDLWKLLIAEKTEWYDSTDDTKRLLENATLNSLRDKSLYPKLVTIVQIEPDADILSIRAHYGEDKNVWNIGINFLTSKTSHWYALPDIIASKLLTGKTPRILRAISFRPIGIQGNLQPIEIPGGYSLSPEQDLIKSLIEYRKKIQDQRDKSGKDTLEYHQLDVIQNQLKILANATSYGIFIEINTEDHPAEVQAYGLRSWRTTASKTEEFGEFFNPIIATMLTSGARLMLAMAEAWLENHRGCYAFCDTDSMAVSPFHWKKLQQFFEPLNPFGDCEFLKLEKENYDETGKLRDLWFYGISAKRYVLYVLDEKGEPEPVKWSSHGLGHLLHENESEWQRELWTNVLRYAYGKITKQQLLAPYRGEYAVAKLTLTKPSLLRRVKAISKNRSMEKTPKPHGFMLAGSPTMLNQKGNPIVPITSFVHPYDLAPYQPFTDAKSGRLYKEDTEVYWKTLEQIVEDYIDHPESKFRNGDKIGHMKRRHLLVEVDGIKYIGKESNELEESEVLGVLGDSYVEYPT